MANPDEIKIEKYFKGEVCLKLGVGVNLRPISPVIEAHESSTKLTNSIMIVWRREIVIHEVLVFFFKCLESVFTQLNCCNIQQLL